jgi:NAD(P)-dependent dehydrogenase (short-subunit alcohol dehydrogenase family)
VSRTIAISGSASGMGATLATKLRDASDRVIGIDLHDAEVIADLCTPEGRQRAVTEVIRLSGGALDGLAACAGLPTRAQDAKVVSVNYFGVTALLEGLCDTLAAGREPAAVVIASAAVTFGKVSPEAVELCLAGDEAGACSAAEARPGSGYGSAKLALAHQVRRVATSQRWIGRRMTLNAIAPGVVRTPMTAELLAHPNWVSSVPTTMGRAAEAWELAGVLEFFLGPYSRFITGEVLFVDGGAEASRHTATITARSALEG